ncbi:ABC transporter permease [Desulfolutivibrio sp.]|uniref:ABC transporter permease n=1 Tax=Desulfolutivibrio sp. TaxID=2773296 RepID=UPI002F96C15D
MATGKTASAFFDTGGKKISRQVVLPFRKSLEISIKSIKVRFFRSMITVVGLILAVAFLGFVLAGAEVATGLLRSGDPELRSVLVKAGYDLPAKPPVDVDGRALPESVGAGAKERWIVILSLLVCTVGIVNAQLMAVTERFREIGTMKCLGALDSFVLRLFLLEAGMQGFVGALIGAVFGAVAALLAGLARFGLSALVWLPVGGLALSVGAAIVVGFVLSLAGVVYPAVVAARMRPIEAMRVQE